MGFQWSLPARPGSEGGLMAISADRRAAQRRLARELKEGTFQKSEIGVKARHAAAIGTSDQSDIRADLEERAIRRAVSLLDGKPKFNKKSVETRIKGGVVYDKTYYPLAKLSGGKIVKVDGKTITPNKNSNPVVIKGMSNSQLHKVIHMTESDWIQNSKRQFKRGINHFFYH
jgi:hypothetical protein